MTKHRLKTPDGERIPKDARAITVKFVPCADGCGREYDVLTETLSDDGTVTFIPQCYVCAAADDVEAAS